MKSYISTLVWSCSLTAGRKVGLMRRRYIAIDCAAVRTLVEPGYIQHHPMLSGTATSLQRKLRTLPWWESKLSGSTTSSQASSEHQVETWEGEDTEMYWELKHTATYKTKHTTLWSTKAINPSIRTSRSADAYLNWEAGDIDLVRTDALTQPA